MICPTNSHGVTVAISDTAIRKLQPKAKSYSSKAFRYQYRLFGKREKVTIGAYPDVGLAEAREKHAEYRKLVAQGQSPARLKQHQSTAEAQAQTIKEFAEFWMATTDSGPRLAQKSAALAGTRRLPRVRQSAAEGCDPR